jgi:hypothetical protein
VGFDRIALTPLVICATTSSGTSFIPSTLVERRQCGKGSS